MTTSWLKIVLDRTEAPRGELLLQSLMDLACCLNLYLGPAPEDTLEVGKLNSFWINMEYGKGFRADRVG